MGVVGNNPHRMRECFPRGKTDVETNGVEEANNDLVQNVHEY